MKDKTKETILQHHLVPKALVPRTEVTLMPWARGGRKILGSRAGLVHVFRRGS